jgi:NADPH-dependent glutamate synthase beta subunit-like oxidoreductase
MTLERRESLKRAVTDRTKDFKEFVIPLSPAEQSEQAKRCMDCGVPFCQTETGCPLENKIPDGMGLSERGIGKKH